jgi:hypothetical protein
MNATTGNQEATLQENRKFPKRDFSCPAGFKAAQDKLHTAKNRTEKKDLNRFPNDPVERMKF